MSIPMRRSPSHRQQQSQLDSKYPLDSMMRTNKLQVPGAAQKYQELFFGQDQSVRSTRRELDSNFLRRAFLSQKDKQQQQQQKHDNSTNLSPPPPPPPPTFCKKKNSNRNLMAGGGSSQSSNWESRARGMRTRSKATGGSTAGGKDVVIEKMKNHTDDGWSPLANLPNPKRIGEGRSSHAASSNLATTTTTTATNSTTTTTTASTRRDEELDSRFAKFGCRTRKLQESVDSSFGTSGHLGNNNNFVELHQQQQQPQQQQAPRLESQQRRLTAIGSEDSEASRPLPLRLIPFSRRGATATVDHHTDEYNTNSGFDPFDDPLPPPPPLDLIGYTSDDLKRDVADDGPLEGGPNADPLPQLPPITSRPLATVQETTTTTTTTTTTAVTTVTTALLTSHVASTATRLTARLRPTEPPPIANMSLNGGTQQKSPAAMSKLEMTNAPCRRGMLVRSNPTAGSVG